MLLTLVSQADLEARELLRTRRYKRLGLNGDTILCHAMTYLMDRKAYEFRRTLTRTKGTTR